MFIFSFFEQGHQRVGHKERAAEGDGEEEPAPETAGEADRGEPEQDALPDQAGGESAEA